MAVLSMEALPLGYRFRPTDEELINHYLRQKINGRDSEVQVIPEVDICKWEPWDLPGLSVIKTEDPEWFFFCPRDRKYPNGHRSNRATDAGYWKATGKDRTIKSRKSSSSLGRSNNKQLIGMKKTLVFYRGRAPKGERTNWIMHEYRATEKDLDGTNPGQGAYVLCRLFHKTEEKFDVLKYDEVEPTGFSPTTTKSPPDDTSSDLFQEPSLQDVQIKKQPEGITRWLTDKADNTASNVLLPVESCSSDVEDLSPEETVTPVYPLLGGDSVFHEPTYDQIDCKVFSPMPSQIQTELGAYMDSPFANDFGNDQNGLHFQDGTSELDAYLTELLEDLRNHDELWCEESMSRKNSTTGSETQMSGNMHRLPRGLPGNSHVVDRRIFPESDSHMAQLEMQTSSQAQVSMYDTESILGHSNVLGGDYIGQGALSADSLMGSFYGSCNSLEEMTSQTNPNNFGSDHAGGTDIKLRIRQPKNRQNYGNLSKQGTASRRIRLLTEPSSGSVCCSNSGVSTNYSEEEEQEALSAANEAKGHAENDLIAEEPEEEGVLKFDGERNIKCDGEKNTKCEDSTETDQDHNVRRRLRMKGDVQNDQMPLSLSSTASFAHHTPRFSSLKIVGIFLVITLFIVSIGTWR